MSSVCLAADADAVHTKNISAFLQAWNNICIDKNIYYIFV